MFICMMHSYRLKILTLEDVTFIENTLIQGGEADTHYRQRLYKTLLQMLKEKQIIDGESNSVALEVDVEIQDE